MFAFVDLSPDPLQQTSQHPWSREIKIQVNAMQCQYRKPSAANARTVSTKCGSLPREGVYGLINLAGSLRLHGQLNNLINSNSVKISSK